MTHTTSGRASWMAPWMTYPLTFNSSIAVDGVAVGVHLQQVGCGYFVIAESEAVDEKAIFSRNPRGYMIPDNFAHMVLVGDPVTGGEINTQVPLRLAHGSRQAAGISSGCHGSVLPLSKT